MAKMSEDKKTSICNEYKSGVSVKKLAEKYQVSDQTIYNILKTDFHEPQKGKSKKAKSKKPSKTDLQHSESGPEIEDQDEEDIDWESWANFWKEKYLEAHSKLLELGHA